jgi:hypothetical protein
MVRFPFPFGDRRPKADAAGSETSGLSRQRRRAAQRTRRNSTSLLSETLEPRAMMAADIVQVAALVPSGSYRAGQVIPISVDFSEAVTVSGSPLLFLNNSGRATFTGSNTSGTTLFFNYTVQPGDQTAELDVLQSPGVAIQFGTLSTTSTFDPSTPSTINDAIRTVVAADDTIADRKAIVIDTTAPSAPTVNRLFVNPIIHLTATPGSLDPKHFTLTGTAVLGTGEQLRVTANGATYAPAVVGGNWDLNLLTAMPVSGALLNPWTSTNVSSYSVEATVIDAAGNSASDSTMSEIVIDMVAPSITHVKASTPDGAYTVGDEIFIDVEFNEGIRVVTSPVAGGVSPRLQLNSNTNRFADFATIVNGNIARFKYTVQAGDAASDLDYAAPAAPNVSALLVGGGYISDIAGNAASVVLPAPAAPNSLGSNSGIVIDTVAPVVNDVLSAPDPYTYVAGQTIPISIVLNKQVLVTSSPTLSLNVVDRNGNPLPRQATFFSNVVSGTGSNAVSTLNFNYLVQPGDVAARLDYTSVSALSLGGPGVIEDLAGNALVLTLPAPGLGVVGAGAQSLGVNSNIRIAAAPVVTDVRSLTPDGTYSEGATIAIQVTFSEAVRVTGSPTLKLNAANGNALATYVSGADTKFLRFEYKVRPGDNTTTTLAGDLDYTAVNDLGVGSGAIFTEVTNAVGGAQIVANNNAVLTLPAPGAGSPGSLGFNSNVVIVLDTTAPPTPLIALANDIGSSTTDGISNDGTIRVTFVETPARWQPFVNGQAFGPELPGTTNTFALPDGTYAVGQIGVRQWDPSGNPSNLALNTMEFRIERGLPLPLVVSVTDTADPNDGVTSNATITVAGLEATGTLQLSLTGAAGPWLSAPIGVASITIPNDGTYAKDQIVVRQMDQAGNLSPAMTVVNPNGPFVIDRLVAQLGAAFVDTNVVGDGVTNNGTITVTGLEPTARLQMSLNGGATFGLETTPGVASITIPNDGTYAAGSIVVRQVDQAGNISLPTVVNPATTIVLDRQVGVLGAVLTDTNVTGDGVTNDNTIDTTGSEAGATLQLTTDAGVNWQPLPAGTTTVVVPEGEYAAGSVRIRQIDLAGNIGEATLMNPTAKLVVDRTIATPVLGPLAADLRTYPIQGLNTNPGDRVRVTANGTVFYDGPSQSLPSFTLEPGLYDVGSIVVQHTDLAGNSVTVANTSQVSAGIYATATGFGRTTATAPRLGGPVANMLITFNVPVTDFSLRSMRLLWNGRSMSLRGARLVPTNGGTTYRLIMPRTMTNRRGEYRLEINGLSTNVRSVASGAQMTTPSNIFWYRR